MRSQALVFFSDLEPEPPSESSMYRHGAIRTRDLGFHGVQYGSRTVGTGVGGSVAGPVCQAPNSPDQIPGVTVVPKNLPGSFIG
ncbi:hypothetical protein M404DRAFT_1006415 [Pisolithus tinctorius Marx 270]|uniref:Uncharacterized protein n=1 Tax=Pisolithus tinctorius Marx 270 TaxID=870435 RepID=A0A0C3N794_PISTI|nr:hypothetical protein M404DRAFT_1006415 [Pisolithus tinctorius Marx 270]